MSPEATKREAQKVNILLEINRVLIQELAALQSMGRGGSGLGTVLGRGPETQNQGGQQSPTGTDSGKDSTAEMNNPANADGEAKPEDKDKKVPPSRDYVE